MSEEMFEKDDILTDEELENLDEVEVDDEKEEEKEEDERGLSINILCIDKWKKHQTLSFIDLSSLDGLVSTLIKISTIVLLVKYIKLKKRK